jgi:hypothetical protein
MRFFGLVTQFIDDNFRLDEIRSDAIRYRTIATEVLSAMMEGLTSAQHYDRLARMISTEHAERADIARIAVLGRSL